MSQGQPLPWVREHVLDDVVLVELSGEIDALAAPRLMPYMDSLAACPRPDIVVDLRPVTFIDCSGLTVLVRLHNRARERAGRVRLVCADPRTLRTMRITQLTSHFEILDAWPEPSHSVDHM